MIRTFILVGLITIPRLTLCQTWTQQYGDVSEYACEIQGVLEMDAQHVVVDQTLTYSDRQSAGISIVSTFGGEIIDSLIFGEEGDTYLWGGSTGLLDWQGENASFGFATTRKTGSTYHPEFRLFDESLNVISQFSFEFDSLFVWGEGFQNSDSSLIITGIKEVPTGHWVGIIQEITLNGIVNWSIEAPPVGSMQDFGVQLNQVVQRSNGQIIASGFQRDYTSFDQCSNLAYNTDLFVVDFHPDTMAPNSYLLTNDCTYNDLPAAIITDNDHLLLASSKIQEGEECSTDYWCYKATIDSYNDVLDFDSSSSTGPNSIISRYKDLHKSATSGELIFAIGETWSPFGGQYEGIISKHEANTGGTEWTRYFRHNPEMPSGFRGITELSDGRIIGVGFTQHSVTNPSRFGWITCLDEFGCLEPGCQNLNTHEFSNEKIDIVISRNLENNIQISSENELIVRIEVFDLIGRAILEKPLHPTLNAQISDAAINSESRLVVVVHLQNGQIKRALL